jgi:hypothetical protein
VILCLFLQCYPLFYAEADIIFHDCKIANYPNSVHAQLHQLETLTEDVKSKMWLYHYSLNDKSYEELNEEIKAKGFAGLVKEGQEFII